MGSMSDMVPEKQTGIPEIESVTQDPVVKREAKRWGGPKSLLGRAMLAVSLIGGGAGLVACGESQVNDPASFMINTGQASESATKIVQEAFKDVKAVNVPMRPYIPFSPEDVWHKNSVSLSQSDSISVWGSLTILTDQKFSPPEAGKQWRAFGINDKGESMMIGEVRSASADTLIDKTLLAPEDRGNEAIRIFLSGGRNRGLGRTVGMSVFLQQVDSNNNYSPDQASLRAFNIVPIVPIPEATPKCPNNF